MAVITVSKIYFGGWALLLMGAGLAWEAAALTRAAAYFIHQSGGGR